MPIAAAYGAVQLLSPAHSDPRRSSPSPSRPPPGGGITLDLFVDQADPEDQFIMAGRAASQAAGSRGASKAARGGPVSRVHRARRKTPRSRRPAEACPLASQSAPGLGRLPRRGMATLFILCPKPPSERLLGGKSEADGHASKKVQSANTGVSSAWLISLWLVQLRAGRSGGALCRSRAASGRVRIFL